ncbi:HNH endonuclease signature motif containing protein [Acidovorax sp. FG27]|uniref:HNH endonuclease n=1 Tax=Acidovorax sp. FG27 TaxID=3133652 RepID=UPI0030E89460
MADTDYARLRIGGLGLVCLIANKPGRGRSKGATSSYTLKDSTPRVCAADCGKTFVPRAAHSRFCSRKCQTKINNRGKQAARRDSTERPCNYCRAQFIPEYGSLRRTYCTTTCRDEAKRKVRSGSCHRRRAEKNGGRYEPVSKRKVFERDGWRCYLCGCDTPLTKSGTQDDAAPELDHVIPLAAGGDHTYENTRCACRRCNRAKGSTIPAQGLQGPPRQPGGRG